MTEPSSQSNRESLSHGGVFVGRQQEMAVLERALNDALSGHGRLVMLAGEPGIGKTRLCQELVARADTLGARESNLVRYTVTFSVLLATARERDPGRW